MAPPDPPRTNKGLSRASTIVRDPVPERVYRIEWRAQSRLASILAVLIALVLVIALFMFSFFLAAGILLTLALFVVLALIKQTIVLPKR